VSDLPKPAQPTTVKLRSKKDVEKARKAEIVRALRDAAEAQEAVPTEWIQELAQLVDVDIRKR
jgi:hypothetical protein